MRFDMIVVPERWVFMIIYFAIETIATLVAAIIIAARAKKADGVVYGKLDKAGRITNILLIPIYICLTLFSLAISFFTYPEYDGFLGILGWIVTLIIASPPALCSLGLGFSVALRKKGRSKLSFAVQFAGVAGVALAFLLFVVFYGNLLHSLN